MRMWEAGAPIEGGNEIGIPDVDYFDYLKERSDDYESRSSHSDRNHDSKLERIIPYDELLKEAEKSFDLGIYHVALNYYNQALNRRYSEEAAFGKAQCLEKFGNFDEASQLYYDLGDRNYWHGGDKNAAVEYYKKSIQCNPNNEETLEDLAYTLRNFKRYDEALEYYSRVKSKDVGWSMAICYMGLKQYENALPLLDKYVEECPYCDGHLDEKYECLIGLNRKDEAVRLWKHHIDFLIDNECYERALKRLDLLRQNTGGEDVFIEDRREKCLIQKQRLEARFSAISDIMSQYHMYNPNGLDENDLKGFMKFVCEQSGESVDDIVRWYTTPMLGSSSFRAICADHLYYVHWDRIVEMYNEGKLGDL